MPTHLKQCHFEPFGSSSSKARPMLLWPALPTENSMTMMGSPKMTRNTRYMRTNAAPPYSPVM